MRNRNFHVAVDPSANTTVTVVQHTPTHWFHLVMTLVTGGLWLPVWIAVSYRARRNVTVTAVATATAQASTHSPDQIS